MPGMATAVMPSECEVHMKKVTVSIQYDEEKINALKIFAPKNNVSVEAELVSALDRIYNKNVPKEVRDFIVGRYGEERT